MDKSEGQRKDNDRGSPSHLRGVFSNQRSEGLRSDETVSSLSSFVLLVFCIFLWRSLGKTGVHKKVGVQRNPSSERAGLR